MNDTWGIPVIGEIYKMLEESTEHLMKEHESLKHIITETTTHNSKNRTFLCSCGEVFIKDRNS
jgi:hypothetical protein